MGGSTLQWIQTVGGVALPAVRNKGVLGGQPVASFAARRSGGPKGHQGEGCVDAAHLDDPGAAGREEGGWERAVDAGRGSGEGSRQGSSAHTPKEAESKDGAPVLPPSAPVAQTPTSMRAAGASSTQHGAVLGASVPSTPGLPLGSRASLSLVTDRDRLHLDTSELCRLFPWLDQMLPASQRAKKGLGVRWVIEWLIGRCRRPILTSTPPLPPREDAALRSNLASLRSDLAGSQAACRRAERDVHITRDALKSCEHRCHEMSLGAQDDATVLRRIRDERGDALDRLEGAQRTIQELEASGARAQEELTRLRNAPPAPSSASDVVVEALRGQVAVAERSLADMRVERDGLREDKSRLQDELRDARAGGSAGRKRKRRAKRSRRYKSSSESDSGEETSSSSERRSTRKRRRKGNSRRQSDGREVASEAPDGGEQRHGGDPTAPRASGQ